MESWILWVSYEVSEANENTPATEIIHDATIELVFASFEILGKYNLSISAMYRPPSSGL